MSNNPPYVEDISWLRRHIQKLPTRRKIQLISKWAEKKRYLSSALTSNAGPYSNTYAPYTVEIMDNLTPDNPIREVAWMKAGQIGATTAVLENWWGYIIDESPGPSMYLTGSDEMAKSGVEIRLDRMLDSADLWDKIKASGKKTRKTGNTVSRKDFLGGFLLTYGGQSVKKIKLVSVKNLGMDEIEEMPLFLGNQGDPIALAKVRQKAFDHDRKTLYLSTPVLVNGPIHRIFLLGDQRQYYVPCKYCGFMQVLTFRGTREDGKKFGIHYELDADFILIYESVEYRCENCLKGWKNYDKYDFLNAGEWRPTTKAQRRLLRSYQLGGEYSPEGNYSWESMVEEWLGCWDERTKRIFDVEALKVFQNTARGLPFEELGESPKFERVIQHRRQIYESNEIPNKRIFKETGSVGLLVTAAFDVHKNWIGVEIKLWTPGARSYSLDWRILEGATDDLQSAAWEAVRQIIETEVWIADDGKRYNVVISLIDASYRTDSVYQFASEYSANVYAIMGRETSPKNAQNDLFSSYQKKGLIAYNLNVTRYKDRLAANLRKDWNHGELQPFGYNNFPHDYGDDFFRQYEAEEKKQKKYKTGTKALRFVWAKRDENLPNHAWDCAVYGLAAVDIVCYGINLTHLGQDRIDYAAFWDYIAENKIFYSEAA